MSRIINLTAENFKILKAVEINPDGSIVEIGGRNGQGKSSVLDAIWVALKGRAVAPPKPIRLGENECRISLAIGDGPESIDYIIARKFTAKEGGGYSDSFKVMTGQGLIVPQPQSVIDAILGHIGFDPLAFVGMRADEQAETLLGMVPLPVDLESLAEADTEDFAARTLINRDAKTLEGQIAGIAEEADLPADAPDRSALVEKLSSAAEHNSRIAQAEQAHEREDQALTASDRLIEELETRLAEIKEQRADQAAWIAKREPLAERMDIEALRTQVNEADQIAARIAAQARRKELVEQHAAKIAESAALTAALEKREVERRDALSKAKMPIAGLGFVINEKGKPVVTFNDLPFEQASSADQIRASTAIAMAANPELRVLRIKDGSLLDADSRRIIAEMADGDDFQVLIEIVGEGASGFIIEAGEVVGAEAAAEPEEKPEKKAKAAKGEKPADGKLL